MVDQVDNSGEDESSGSTRFTEEQAREAQAALTHRPRISIRLRIAAGFLVTFVDVEGQNVLLLAVHSSECGDDIGPCFRAHVWGGGFRTTR